MEQIHNLNHLFAVVNEEGKYNPKALNVRTNTQMFYPQNKLIVIFFVSISMNSTIQLNAINTHFANQHNNLVSYFIVDTDNAHDIVQHYGIKKVPFFMLFYNKKIVKTLDANNDELSSIVINLTKMIQEKHMKTIEQFSNDVSYSLFNNNEGFAPFGSNDLGFPSSTNNNRDFFGSGTGC